MKGLPPDPPHVDALLRRYRDARNPDDFGRLFDEASPVLFRLAVRLTQDGPAAEDVVQETFLAVLEHVDAWDAARGAMPWLTGILQRKATDVWRARRRERRSLPRPAPPEDPTDRAARREEGDLVRAAIDDLEPPYRRVAVLRWRYGLEPGEIADALGENPASVRSLLHRAKAKLEGRLGPAFLPALFAFPAAPRSLAVVRAEVAAAARALPVPLGATPAVAATTGGLLMGKKTLVAFVVLLGLALGGGLILKQSRSSVAPGDDTVRTASTFVPPGLADEEGKEEPGAARSLPPPVDLARVDRDRDVHGRVTDRDDRPVAGAAVTLSRFPWRRTNVLHPRADEEHEVVAETLTAADGTFSLRLRRGALVELRVVADGFMPAMSSRVQAGERVDVALVARASGVELVVAVTDEEDRPVADAMVTVQQGSRRIEPALTDERGRARFAALPSPYGGRVGIGIEAEGYGDAPWTWVALANRGRHVETVRLPPGRTITGTVTAAADGAAIKGAVVGIGWKQRRAVRTGADGRYELPGWMHGPLSVTAPGYGRHQEGVGERDVVDFRLERGDAVIGRVLDRHGVPIRGARVAAIGMWLGGDVQVSFGHATTDAAGRFRVGDLRRDVVHTLVAMAPGHGRGLFTFRARDGGPGEIDLGDVRLSAARSVEGVVLDAAGEPVRSVEVGLVGPAIDPIRGLDGPGNRLTMMSVPFGGSEERRTDDLGRFRFPDLAPGEYTIVARPEGAPPGSATRVVGDADVRGVVVRLAGDRSVTVTVLDVNGEPAEGVLVRVRGSPATDARTDQAGVCRLTLAGPASPELIVLGPEREGVLRPEPRTLSPDAREATLRFRRAHVVRALVLDPSGTPVGPEVEVRLRGEGLDVRGRTDGEGRIEHKVRAPDRVDVSVDGRAWRPGGRYTYLPLAGEAHGVIPDGEEAVIRCRRVVFDRTLTVRIVDPDDRPVSGVWVVSQDAGLVFEASKKTDEEGLIELAGLRSGVSRFEAVLSWHREKWVRPAPQRVEPAGQTITMRMRRPSAITGIVVDRSGRAAHAARVSARAPSGEAFHDRADTDGRFSIRVPSDVPTFTLTAEWHTLEGATPSVTLEDVRPGSSVRLAER